MHAFGNMAFPACAMVVAALVAKSALGGMAEERSWAVELRWWYAAPFFLVFATILVTRLTVHASDLQSRLTQIWNALPADYGLRIRSLDPTVVLVRDSAGFASLNVIVLLALFAAAWCVFCVADSNSSRAS